MSIIITERLKRRLERGTELEGILKFFHYIYLKDTQTFTFGRN